MNRCVVVVSVLLLGGGATLQCPWELQQTFSQHRPKAGGREFGGHHQEVQTPTQIWGITDLISTDGGFMVGMVGENRGNKTYIYKYSNQTVKTEYLLLLWANLLIILSIYVLNRQRIQHNRKFYCTL